MKFNNLIKGKLIKRYLRFLADVELENEEIVKVHCTNTGSMKSVVVPGADVLISPAKDPNRKTKFTWEMIQIKGQWVGVNTANANKLAFEWVSNNEIPGLQNLQVLRTEKKFADSRFDIYGHDGEKEVWMEVKNVSLKEGDYALFPDAVTTRGQKHLKTLMKVIDDGHRAAMIYVIQRSDVNQFAAAKEIDMDYAHLLEDAKQKGVEVYACQAKLSEKSIDLWRVLELNFPNRN